MPLLIYWVHLHNKTCNLHYSLSSIKFKLPPSHYSYIESIYIIKPLLQSYVALLPLPLDPHPPHSLRKRSINDSVWVRSITYKYKLTQNLTFFKLFFEKREKGHPLEFPSSKKMSLSAGKAHLFRFSCSPCLLTVNVENARLGLALVCTWQLPVFSVRKTCLSSSHHQYYDARSKAALPGRWPKRCARFLSI